MTLEYAVLFKTEGTSGLHIVVLSTCAFALGMRHGSSLGKAEPDPVNGFDWQRWQRWLG